MDIVMFYGIDCIDFFVGFCGVVVLWNIYNNFICGGFIAVGCDVECNTITLSPINTLPNKNHNNNKQTKHTKHLNIIINNTTTNNNNKTKNHNNKTKNKKHYLHLT